jgi:DNA-directed RNA polymerase beta' subunit
LRKDESGPLSKASFEESVDHMVKSAFAGDVEKTRGVSASIICGKRASIGTGVIELKINRKKLIHAKPVMLDTIQENM